MAEAPFEPRASSDEQILQQQYLRAMSSFEGIVLNQIDVKNKLGDRLSWAVRTGLVILSIIAFSILVLLLTLSSQVNRISEVVGAMNTHFSAVSMRMGEISEDFASMQKQVAHMRDMSEYTNAMQAEMLKINASTGDIQGSVVSIGQQMTGTRKNVQQISATMNAINHEVQGMSAEMHRMAKPARALNNMFPFP
jgi:methyl-accepting chemotaxis protein